MDLLNPEASNGGVGSFLSHPLPQKHENDSPMNRIYQARLSGLEVSRDGKDFEAASFGSLGRCPLWSHHQLFQDAVNYYLVALGALADQNSDNRVIRDLRARLEEWWGTRGGDGRECLRDSIRRVLSVLPEAASLDDAFGVILEGSTSKSEERVMALTLLLSKCGGDAAIQQGGRGYFPRLCDPKCNPTWDYSPEALAAEDGASRLAAVIHGEGGQKDLEAIAVQMELGWTVKVQPGSYFEGEDAKNRLKEAIVHWRKAIASPSPRLSEALASIEADPDAELVRFEKETDKLPDDLTISRNRKAAPDLTFASLLFKHFPCELTRALLKLGTKAPKVGAVKATADPLASLGDDPIKLARGSRGLVFPAFTALPAWNPASPGEPVWKEFDIAAFKEALKALNQFNQKTLERDEKLAKAETLRAYMLGESDVLPKSSEGAEESSAPPRPGADEERWKLLQDLEKELGENLNEGGWGLSRASLRGFRDIVEIWNKKPAATPGDLRKIVVDYQADEKNRRDIGSVQLFLLLCEERYHKLWKTNDPEDDRWKILQHAVQVHQLEREIERFKKPIRLTPANAVHSRRLFMFSDLKDKVAKVKFGTHLDNEGSQRNYVEAAIALREGAIWSETRVRMFYSAPRLHRDELLGGEESRWLQPMMAALGFVNPDPRGAFDSALSLMPEQLGDGTIRHLLNLPVTLDAAPLHAALGKAERWKGQFNGTKDKSLHLHWPGTEKTDATKRNRWWENPEVIANGFTVLANDMGQRNAGAWSLLRVTCWKPDTKRPVRSIGHDGTREWFAEVIATGMYRLPGENQRVLVKGEWKTEKSGAKGRMPTEDEYRAARNIAKGLGTDKTVLSNWLGEEGEKSFPELNDKLITIANRRLSRLGTYHRWSCFSVDHLPTEERKQKAKENLERELSAYQDERVKVLADVLSSGDVDGFRSRAGSLFEDLRDELNGLLVQIADRVAPLRRGRWVWDRPSDAKYGQLIRDESDHTPKIRGQRGLSMDRLEQVEGLRRLFLRFNRAWDREAGVAAKFGRDDRGRESGEPCRELLDKIERMKEQRINQTAHLMLAQALGVRLKAHEVLDPKERQRRDLHGEYEKIPGREPVDFIVIEDLSRYLSSQGRAPSENSRLMKWAHRAVRDKLKMLAEEPFGISVVEVVPAYSSRFHAANGQPGSRLYEFQKLEKFHRTSLEKLAGRTAKNEKVRADAAAKLIAQFEQLDEINEELRAARKPQHTLFFPRAGGPLFLAAKDGSPVQADVNAASNLGFRAIAAPGCIDIHRRIRATTKRAKNQVEYIPRTDNAREKAAFDAKDRIVMEGKISKKFEKSTSPNFFYEPDGLMPTACESFDRAMLNGKPLASGVALWSIANDAIFLRCVELNDRRLNKWIGDKDDISV